MSKRIHIIRDGKCVNCPEAKLVMKDGRLKCSVARKLQSGDKRSQKRRETLKVYGLTPEEYDVLIKLQSGLCAICDKPETKIVNGTLSLLSVDHCHKTGKNRQLLCSQCNLMLGNANDDPEILRRGI